MIAWVRHYHSGADVEAMEPDEIIERYCETIFVLKQIGVLEQ